MSDEYYEADNKDGDLNPDDEEFNDENISEEGDQQIEEELKEEEKNKNSEEEEDDDKMDEENENIEIMDNQDVQKADKMKKNPADRITPKFMTKYERARIIGTRALQISKNSIVYVDLGRGFVFCLYGLFIFLIDDYDPIAIAEKELVERKIPFVIRRYLPDKTYEDWDANELIRLD